MFERDGTATSATIVRMSVARVQSVKDLMELMTRASTYAGQKGDEIAKRYFREALDGVVQVLVEHHDHERAMSQRFHQVNVESKTPVN